jgi:hypothetical protein
LGYVLIATAGSLGLVAICTMVVHLAWNLFMPAAFGLPLLSFWGALGLVILVAILGVLWRRVSGPSPRRRRYFWTSSRSER